MPGPLDAILSYPILSYPITLLVFLWASRCTSTMQYYVVDATI